MSEERVELNARSGFSLVKWYVDVADTGDRAAIAYHARLKWRRISLTYQSVVRYSVAGTRDVRRSLRSSAGPRADGRTVTWTANALDLSVRAESRVDAIDVELWNGVRWRCAAPVADVTIDVGDDRLTGAGYAECLSMTVPPWELPIAELRWGRWSDDARRHSLVWIDWQPKEENDVQRRWVFLDGSRVEALVSDDRIGNEAFDLALHKRGTLERRSLETLAHGLPRLLGVLPPSIRRMREEKWLSSGKLHRRSQADRDISGISIHEVVTFG